MQTVVPFACFLSMIRPPGVQFENSLLQIAPVDKAKCPYVKDHNDIAFQMYTRHNPTTYQELVINDDEKLFASNIDWHANTVIYFHAFMEMPDEGSGLMVREAYILRGDTNVIMVDAQRLEAGPWYFTAAENTWYIGQFAAQFIDYLVSRGLDLSRTHLIGHSLGAQAAGVAGAAIKSGKVARITGLDPALPLFHGLPLEQQLDASDAHFVDVIHTDGGIFGVHRPLGHADFYPNGGISPQPGCELEVVLPQQLLLNNCNRTAHPDGLYAFYLKPNPIDKSSRFKLERRIQKLFSYLQFTKADIGKRKNYKTGAKRIDNYDNNGKNYVQNRINLRSVDDKVDNSNVNFTLNFTVESNDKVEDIAKETYAHENMKIDSEKTEKELSNPKDDTNMKIEDDRTKLDNPHDWTMLEDQIMTDSVLQPYVLVIKPVVNTEWFYIQNYATKIKDGDERIEINADEKESRANTKINYESIELKQNQETFEPRTELNFDSLDQPKVNNKSVELRKVNYEPRTDFNNESAEPKNLNNESFEPKNLNYESAEPTKLNYESVEPTKVNYEAVEPTNLKNDAVDPSKQNYESIERRTELPLHFKYDELTQNQEPIKKSHVVKRQKRFINFFKQSETAEQNNFLFKMLDFLLKNRKHALPVYTVMREINTLVKSANGELNHSTKERNNYIGAPPPSVIPLTYNLEIGNENRIVAFMKKLVGLTPKGDKLVISG